MRAWDRPWIWMLLISVLFCAPLFAGLDRQDLENDEPIYAFSIRTMVQHGGWLTPKSIPNDTEPWLEKPPLKFWIVGLPMHWGLLPTNEFGMRFWDAVMSSVAFLYIFAIGRRIGGPVCGLGAVFLLFIHDRLLFEHGLRSNNMESALFLAYAAAMYHFLAWRRAAPDNTSHLVAIALYFVLGFMTKFVAALFLPVVIGIAALMTHEDRVHLWLSRHSLVWISLMVLVLVSPWFAYQYAVSGTRLVEVMFGMHVMQRLTATLDPQHLHPWHFYITELWRSLVANGTAWLTIAGAALLLAKTIRRRWADGLLIVLWFAVPIALMSLGTSKLYHYAYPFLPPVAIAGGYAVARIADWLSRPLATLPSVNWSRTPGIRIGATLIGSVGLLVAIATALLGHVRLATGDIVFLRNDSVVRPTVVWLAAWIIGAPTYLLRSILPLVVMILILLGAGYRSVLDRAMVADRPLHDVAACLSRVASSGPSPPGVLVEAAASSHGFSYYLHDLGSWDTHEQISNESIATHLSAGPGLAPVLVTPKRIARFQNEMRGDNQTRIGVFEHAGSLLLLPGPYAICAPAR